MSNNLPPHEAEREATPLRRFTTGYNTIMTQADNMTKSDSPSAVPPTRQTNISPSSLQEPGGGYSNPDFYQNSSPHKGHGPERPAPGVVASGGPISRRPTPEGFTNDRISGSISYNPFSSSSYRVNKESSRNFRFYEWKERWNKYAGILTTLLVVIICILLTINILQCKGYHFISYQLLQVCDSNECVEAAVEIKSGMDESISPCSDFYHFACGGWQREHPPPQKIMNWNTFRHTHEKMYFKLKAILEEPVEEVKSDAEERVRTAYKACVNDTLRTELGIQPLLSLLDDLGGFPLISPNWNATNFDWKQTISVLRKQLKANYIIRISIEPDNKNNSQYIINLSEGSLPSPKQYLAQNSTDVRLSETHRISILAKEMFAMSVLSNNSMLGKSTNSDNLQRLVKLLKQQEQQHIHNINKNKYNIKNNINIINNNNSNSNSAKTFPLKIEEMKMYDNITMMNALLMVEFYIQAAMMMNNESKFNPETYYNKMTIGEFSNLVNTNLTEETQIDWLELLSDVFSDVPLELNSDTQINVQNPKYFEKLNVLLANTSPLVLANCLLYPLILNLGTEVSTSSTLRKVFIEASKEFELYESPNDLGIIGRQDFRPWYDCVGKAINFYSKITTQLYVGKHFNEEDILEAESLGEEIQSSLEFHLKESWMDEETKDAALQKAKEMQMLVGFPKELLMEDLNLHYEGLDAMSTSNHFSNILNLLAYNSNNSLQLIKKQPSRTNWLSTPLTVNAFYSPTQNTMQIPAGIMQPPYFRSHTLLPLTYGAIGLIVGHEIMHGFDVHGRYYNWEGNLFEWWTETSAEQYANHANCYQQFYENLTLPDHQEYMENNYSVNGTKTQGENIADNEGMYMMLRAYDKAKQRFSEKRLITLEKYSMDQLLFIVFAQMWCSNVTPEGLQMDLTYNVHSPAPFRVLGVLSNSRRFQEVFHCPAESKMVAEETCQLL